MKKRLTILLLLPILGTTLPWTPFAHAGQPSEYEIKAAFLYNFAKFVTWPEWKFDGKDAPIVIAVLGGDPFGEVLDQTVKDKTIAGRPLHVRRIQSVRESKGVHLLFFGRMAAADLERAVHGLDKEGLLAVGDSDGFALRHGTIGFFMEENRVRFEVNVAAAEAAGLKISSKLLQLARVIGHGEADAR
ncbi:MAG: YfiR family protein [Candidatus Latescibacterota bacterium]|nr:MAG: YfiR family protein [Candidatus Latescibacterota bacterium]